MKEKMIIIILGTLIITSPLKVYSPFFYEESEPIVEGLWIDQWVQEKTDDLYLTYLNIPYSEYKENTFNFWKVPSTKKTKLIVYFHGGGFTTGDKMEINEDVRQAFLSQGISVASVDYHNISKTISIKDIMIECARAIQFMKYYHNELNINKTEIEVFGESAGGGIALWLAVHDDLKKIDNGDLILRESSKVKIARPINPQATYNCDRWEEILNTREGCMDGDLDMVSLIDSKDATLYIKYTGPEDYINYDSKHNLKHGLYLKDKCDEVGLDCELLIKPQGSK